MAGPSESIGGETIGLIAERGSLGHRVFPHRHDPRLSTNLLRIVPTAAYSEEET